MLHSVSNFKNNQRTLTVSLVGKVLPQDSLLLAMTDKLPQYHLAGTKLRIIQGDSYDANFDATQVSSTMLRDMYQVTQNTINSQRETIDSLKTITADVARNDTIGATISPELKVLFPQVRDIAVTRAIVSNVDSRRLDTLDVALVSYSNPMPTAQNEKFLNYLRARLNKPKLTLIPVR